MGGVVAAAVGGLASPSDAEDATARGPEVIAREAPGTGQAGIAVVRGNDRVHLVGERDGWSEILLRDGRRAWVPSAEITRIAAGGGTPAAAPSIGRSPSPGATALPKIAPAFGANSGDAGIGELANEVTRLRQTVDQLTAGRAIVSDPTSQLDDRFSWMIAGAALALGLLIGGAWERRRSRRERSLKF